MLVRPTSLVVVATLLHNTYEHLDKPKTYVRTLFIDFSSAFNTIKPHILLSKLLNMNINPHLALWIADFLNFRPQRVRFANTFSDITHISTGVPQGCVLSPLLFSMYTSDFHLDNNKCVLTKYADDTALTGLITNNDEVWCRNEITKFIVWCENNYLVLNVNKTKEIVFDFRKTANTIEPVTIKEESVEIVKELKYLGTFIDSKLNWNANTTHVYKRSNQRLYFLRKLKSFNVNTNILKLFYQSTIQSILSFCCVCWFNSLSQFNSKKLQRITKRASRIIGADVKGMREIMNDCIISQINKIICDPNHPLHPHIIQNHSGRIRQLRLKTNRFKDSFLPSAIQLFNSRWSR